MSLGKLFQIPNLQFPIKYGSGFLVPEKGWYIFGGNSQTQVQSLSSIGSSWTSTFPDIFNGDSSYGHCTIQVSNLVHSLLMSQ